jgi:uncharacterized protein (DUF433 family)
LKLEHIGIGMEWRNHITIDPPVLAGKPIVKGTRISVELVVDPLAGDDGANREQLSHAEAG